MYIFDKITIKQARISAFRWTLFEVYMFDIYIFPFFKIEMEKGT